MSELDELRSVVRGFLDTHAPVGTEDPEVWRRLTTELGLLGLVSEPEPLPMVCVVLEEAGRVLLSAPLLPTLVALLAVPALELPEGGSAALALGADHDCVPHAAGASALLLANSDELLVAHEFTCEVVQTLDQTRPCASVRSSPAPSVGTGADRARDLEQLALAAESVGAAQRLLEMVVEHLLTREQFGRPLGSFQALRHRVADLTVLVESARSSTWYAVQSEDLRVDAPLALAAASDAFRTVAGEAIQLLGGIGFTWEHPAHLYFKRAWTTALNHDSRALRRLAFERAGR